MPCNLCGPRSAPTATPAAVWPRGHTGRVDDVASLECRQLTLSPICQSPGPAARRWGRVVPALSGTAEWAATRQPHGGECRQVRRVEQPGPPMGGPSTAGARRATRTRRLGQSPKGVAPAESAEESGAITQRGAVAATRPLHSMHRLGDDLFESGGGRSPAAGPRSLDFVIPAAPAENKLGARHSDRFARC